MASTRLMGGCSETLQQEEDAQLMLPAQLIEEALQQDDFRLRLDEVLAPSQGSADYDRQTAQFDIAHLTASLPSLLTGEPGSYRYSQQGVLADIQRMWKSFDERLLLWNYADPRTPDIVEYCGVTQQIVAAQTARPKDFVQGVSSFLVIATTVEVSLHALCFEPDSDRLLPIQRTRHCVATDDVIVSAIASDENSGRIFLGGVDGCIHELQYYNEEPVWLGRPRKSRRSVVRSTFSSHFPAVLKRVTEGIANLFSSPSAEIIQLVSDPGRGLLYALSTNSSIMVFQIPPSKWDLNGRIEEPPLQMVCSYFHYQLEIEVARIRAQVFPGLAARSGLGAQPMLFGGGGAVNPLHSASAAAANPLYPGMKREVKVVKILPVSRPQGGDVALSAIAEDGTRIFLRLLYPRPAYGGGVPGGMPGPYAGAASGGAAPGANPQARQPSITGLAVHHARFADLSGLTAAVAGAAAPPNALLGAPGGLATPPPFHVRDAAEAGGVALLLCSVETGLAPVTEDAPAGGAPRYADMIVAISTDLRATAQRQSRGRCPWLTAPPGLAEHMEVLRPSDACQAFVLATLASPLPWSLRRLYAGVSGTSSSATPSAAGQPVLGLSELAQQQLLPPPRFMLVSNLGVHVLSKVRPIEVLRKQLERGDLPALREFSLQHTAEQMAALCFQVLTGVVPKLATVEGYTNDARSRRSIAGGALGNGALSGAGLGAGLGVSGLGAGVFMAATDATSQLDQRSPPQGTTSSPASGFRDEAEELILYRAEQLLLSQELAPQVGFLQAWPSVESHVPEAGSGAPAWAPSLGWSIHHSKSQRLSGRLRGLCLYLSRLLRPLWLAPIMAVTWPARTDNRGLKRRLGEWWPPTPEPPPAVHGAQWRCSWSKAQRSYVQGQLTRLSAVLERVKVCLNPDPRNIAGGAASAGAIRLAQFAGRAAGRAANMTSGSGYADPNAGDIQDESVITDRLSELLSTAIEALSFLELVSARTHTLAGVPCPADVLVRFAEFTFRDLVCQPDVRQVLQHLMRGGVVACRPLHASCPRLFSAADLEVQEACDLLSNVRNSLANLRPGAVPGSQSVAAGGVDAVRLGFLVQRALRTLDRHAAKVDLQDVAQRLRSAGALKGLVALCIRVAQARDPNDECLRPQDPTSTRVQQLHYMRLECYQVVLAVLEDTLLRSQQNQAVVGTSPLLQVGRGTATAELTARLGDTRASEGQVGELPELVAVPVAAADALPTLDALLHHCLEAHPYLADELFHYSILKWMMQRALPVYRYDSPYLKGFLETRAQDQPELLCRYFQHRARWAEAYDSYMALARRSMVSHDEQLVLLQSAALCARMPGSNRRVEPVLRAVDELRATLGQSHHGWNQS